MREEFLVFGSPQIEQAEIDEVVATLKSGWVGTGPKVRRFEEAFGQYKGSRFAVAVSSCSAALHLAMIAVGLQKGDEVILPTLTWTATANAVIHAGGTPVFADCEKESMNIDPNDIERKLSARTRAIIPVHFAGRCCDMDAIQEIARGRDISIVEDCAHAIETEYHGRKAGTIGELGCFSFYATKNVITGEGGMLLTDDESYAEHSRILASQGMSQGAWSRFSSKGDPHSQVVACGYKYNMTDIQAAMGIHQLARVESNSQRRRRIWDTYNSSFVELPVFTPAPEEPGTRHALHLYTLLLDIDNLSITRDRFLHAMRDRNIGVGIHYIALHLHPFYQTYYGYRRGDFPNSEWISERTASIPLSPKLTDKDVVDVVEATSDILSNCSSQASYRRRLESYSRARSTSRSRESNGVRALRGHRRTG
jgi:dTDP-4-amino-4,6-dideoxygalactose transaminase